MDRLVKIGGQLRYPNALLYFTVRQACPVGGSEKNFFGNRKKCSSPILANGIKLVENLCLGVATIFQSTTPQNVIATNDAEGNLHISITTGRRGMAYGSKSVEILCFYLC